MWAQGWFTAQEGFVCKRFLFLFHRFSSMSHTCCKTHETYPSDVWSFVNYQRGIFIDINLLSLHYFQQCCSMNVNNWNKMNMKWDRIERWIFRAARLRKNVFSIGTPNGTASPSQYQWSRRTFWRCTDTTTSPKKKQEQHNRRENENERTRESNAITSGTRRGEVRETRTWRDAKWSETRLSFSPGRAVSWTDGRGAGVETVRYRESWRGKRLMDEYSKFWRGRRPISMNYEWIRPFPLSSSDSFRRLLRQRLLAFSRKLWLSSKVICSIP